MIWGELALNGGQDALVAMIEADSNHATEEAETIGARESGEKESHARSCRKWGELERKGLAPTRKTTA